MKYFLHDSETGKSIDSANPQAISLSQALAIALNLEFDSDTFFGLVRDDGRVLQFAGWRDEKTPLLVDMPIPTKKGSFQLRTVQETSQELIQGFFAGENLEETHKFEFIKWGF